MVIPPGFSKTDKLKKRELTYIICKKDHLFAKELLFEEVLIRLRSN